MVLACADSPLPSSAQTEAFRVRLGAPVAQPPENLNPPKPIPLPLPGVPAADRPLPINLPTALRLAQVEPLDIAIAAQRLEIAAAQLQRANRLWLPTLLIGGDYFRHDGQLQDVAGSVFGASKSTLAVGVGPSMVFAFSDALFGPLAARQVVQARSANVQAAQHDSLLAVAEAYFNVQQARGELAGATDALRRGEDLVRRAEKLAAALVPPLEAARVRTEVARRRQAVHLSREKWQTASAQLARVLRLDATAVTSPLEPPDLRLTLIESKYGLEELIPIALTYRPELAAGQAFVDAALERLRQERLRPLIPSLLLRGAATNPAGGLSTAYFGGGKNDDLSNFGWRNTLDVQLVWELQNLGLGNRARINEMRAENRMAAFEYVRLQDRIAAEVAQARAQVQSAAARIGDAEAGLKDALFSVEKNFEGLQQTRRIGDAIVLVIRPQEAVASLQALGQAYADYYGAVADHNRAQFRLYRALGNPRWLAPETFCSPSANSAS